MWSACNRRSASGFSTWSRCRPNPGPDADANHRACGATPIMRQFTPRSWRGSFPRRRGAACPGARAPMKLSPRASPPCACGQPRAIGNVQRRIRSNGFLSNGPKAKKSQRDTGFLPCPKTRPSTFSSTRPNCVTRPTMRFVSVKTEEQQAVLVMHRTRALLVRQRTMLANAVRAHLAEFGIIAPQGIERMAKLVAQVLGPEGDEIAIPPLVRCIIKAFNTQLKGLQAEIDSLEEKVREWHRTNDDSRRLATIPGVGLITASALAATVQDAAAFASGRAMAAWLKFATGHSSHGGEFG